MRIHGIGPTIARRRVDLPVVVGLCVGLSLAGASCRGGCGRAADPAATAQGRLALLPDATRIVVSIDFAKLRASPAAAKLAALGQQSPDDARALEDFARRTGLDPLAQIDSVLVGFPDDARARGALGLVLRAQHLDQTRLVAYVRDQL